MPWNTAKYKQGLQAMRAYPLAVSRRQINEEIPLGWKQDADLWGYMNKYVLGGSGAGFITPPYTAIWERMWGTVPIEDLPKYKDMYCFTPYIKATIDVTVNLAISNGFELEGSTSKVRDWLMDWLDERNYLETLRISTTDMLVFGNAFDELCRDGDSLVWLKPLDPVHMRVRRDAYGQVFGYIQLLTMPPVVFTAQDMIHFRWGPKSWWYEFSYGSSQLRPLLKIQAYIDQLEQDMAVISHLYTKPMLDVAAGTAEKPYTIDQLNELIDSFSNRGIGSDVFHRGDATVKIIPSMTRDIKIQWWLDYLHNMREGVMGVPRIFMGKVEGTNRATAEVVMQEYVTRLRMIQEALGDQLETVLFKQLVNQEFGPDVEIPLMKWRPIWEPSLTEMAPIIDTIFKDKIIERSEARLRLGFPEVPPISEDTRLKEAPSSEAASLRAIAFPTVSSLSKTLEDLVNSVKEGRMEKPVALKLAQQAIETEVLRMREHTKTEVERKLGKSLKSLGPEHERHFNKLIGDYLSDFKTILEDAVKVERRVLE